MDTNDDPWKWLPLTDLSFQILLALVGGELHGYGILKVISDRTDGRLVPDTGTLYTAIRRLGRDGLILPTASEGAGRRGRTYGLTSVGRAVLEAESRRLASLVEEAGRASILRPPERPGHAG